MHQFSVRLPWLRDLGDGEILTAANMLKREICLIFHLILVVYSLASDESHIFLSNDPLPPIIFPSQRFYTGSVPKYL